MFWVSGFPPKRQKHNNSDQNHSSIPNFFLFNGPFTMTLTWSTSQVPNPTSESFVQWLCEGPFPGGIWAFSLGLGSGPELFGAWTCQNDVLPSFVVLLLTSCLNPQTVIDGGSIGGGFVGERREEQENQVKPLQQPHSRLTQSNTTILHSSTAFL